MKTNNLTPQSIIKYVEEIIGGRLHAKQVESIANAAVGVIKAVDLKIHTIGHGLAAAFDKESKHAIKQIDRYLSNELIALEDFFESWISYHVGGLQDIVIAIDWTDFDQDQHATVTLHMICHHARAMPLVWKTVEKTTLKAHRNDYEDEVLQLLKDHLGDDVQVTVLADRGFADTKLMAYLTELGFQYVIRIKKSFHVTDPVGHDQLAKAWLDEGKKIKLSPAFITAQNVAVESFVAVRDPGMKQAWFLVSSLSVPAAKIIRLYAKRFTIEESYRDFKDDRFGMGLAATHIKKPQRRDRLLLAAAIANMLLTILGAAGEVLGFDRLLKANTVKTRTHSLFRQGVLYWGKLPTLRTDRKRALLTRFADLLSTHQLFAFHLDSA
jgi:hypothetical protein